MSTKLEAAARQALEALEGAWLDASMGKGDVARHTKAITDLREALEEQKATEPATEADMAVYKAIAGNYHASLRQAAEPVVQKRCHLCDCTGDIHSADGEWRGECPYCKPTQQPLTDEQCDAIYTALDEWSREVDAHEFGLPAIAGGGMGKGREIIRAAHGITSKQGGAA